MHSRRRRVHAQAAGQKHHGAINGAAFDAAFKAQPRPLMANTSIVPDSQVQIDGNAIRLTVQNLPVSLRGKTLDVFPETPEVIETAATPTQGWKGAVWTASVPLSAQRSNSPSVMPFVLASGGEAYRAELKVLGSWPTVAAAATVSPALDAALKANAAQASSASSLTLAAALLGALIGGLILNLMPCVFPVLAIKVVSFTRHAEDRRAHRRAGVAYTAGVVVSFMALGALMLGLRAAGESIGWGFQLQSPAVVAALAALFTVIGLNLAGVFEFGSLLPSSVASLQAKNPTLDSFLSGVLAVAIASPCTAPFMGASLGFAVGLPAAQALLVFAAIGIGMALPYLLASWVPAVARALPRPGAWMDTFRKLMAFPMFATVAWLVWVLGQQSGIDGAGALLALLVALSLVVWALTLQGSTRVALGTVSVVLLGALAWGAGSYITQGQASAVTTAAGSRWQAWEPGRVDQIVDTGQPVFVDFTAAWCVTCQYNKKTTLANGDVLADLAAKNVALLRADWTRRDPAITAALAQLGRNGVPVYVFYKKGSPPVVLSEILGVEEVRSVIANALGDRHAMLRRTLFALSALAFCRGSPGRRRRGPARARLHAEGRQRQDREAVRLQGQARGAGVDQPRLPVCAEALQQRQHARHPEGRHGQGRGVAGHQQHRESQPRLPGAPPGWWPGSRSASPRPAPS
jgi:thiol:disulfide interchange protein